MGEYTPEDDIFGTISNSQTVIAVLDVVVFEQKVSTAGRESYRSKVWSIFKKQIKCKMVWVPSLEGGVSRCG